MVAFPRLKRHSIICQYARTPKNILGRVHGKISVTRDVDPEAVLLEGRSSTVVKRKADGKFRITINENLGKIGHPLLRKQVVQHTIIHELFHIENEDLLTLSKDYTRRKKKRIHKKEFDEKIHERFNEIRTASGLPPVRNMADVDAAIHKIVDGINL